MLRTLRLGLAAVLGLAFASHAAADVTIAGDISGQIRTEDQSPVADAAVTLTGAGLIQKAIIQTSNANGVFRFPNLKPGDYTVSVAKPGFATQEIAVSVSVGKTSNVPVTLQVAATTEQVAVQGEAPIIDKTSPQIANNFSVEQLKQLPNNRNFIEAVDTAPGVTNRMAYAAGGNTEGYDPFGIGAATNNYEINGVNVNNLQFGNSWVNPNYDTVQEIQVVGPGASAEYSNYTGAVVNVVTKAGTNVFHGGGTGYFTNHSLHADNSEGIIDLAAPIARYDWEGNVYIGGPIVPERLTFFASAAYLTTSERPADAPNEDLFYESLRRQGYQARLDFLANNANTITAMYNGDPVKNENVGAQAGTGPEVTRTFDQNTHVGFLSWISTWSNSTVSELRYAGVRGHLDNIPASSDPLVYDLRVGKFYNSHGYERNQKPSRDQVLLNVTHYADRFLGVSHEFKAGADYERAKSKQDFALNHNVEFAIIPIGPGVNYINGLTGYNYHVRTLLERPGFFVQDKITLNSRATVNVGLRYDHPTTTDDSTGKTLLKFDNWAPRFGFAYDLAGNGRTVLRVGAGRYYEKVPTYGPATYAGTGQEPVTYYGLVTTEDIDPRDWQHLIDEVIRPENQTTTFDTQSIPVEAGIKNPKSDIVNFGIEHQFSHNVSISFNYLYRHQNHFVVLTQYANPNFYAPIEFTSDFTGQTFTYYTVTGGGPRQFALGNRPFNFQRNHMAILAVRANPTPKLFVESSITYEHSRGTRDNNECAVLSLCSNGVDTDPNYEQNPFYIRGALLEEVPWQFKIRGNYQLPWNIGFAADFRWLAGRHYGATNYCVALGIAGCDPYYSFQVLLEPKDARREQNATIFNLRVSKDILLGPVTVTAVADVLNVLNTQYDMNTNIQNNVSALYGKQSAATGEPVSAFGQPYSIAPGRQARFGLRIVF